MPKAPDFHESCNLWDKYSRAIAAYNATNEVRQDIQAILDQCPNSVLSRLVICQQNATQKVIEELQEVIENQSKIIDDALKSAQNENCN